MRSTTEIIEVVLGDQPNVIAALNDAHSAARAAVDSETLELCRLRVAMLLGNTDELATELPDDLVAAIPLWPSSTRLTSAQRACLGFTEEFVIDVASLSDATAQAVVSELGDQGYADFVNALLVFEQRQRMRLAWQRLFPEVAA
jgi:alkylhydroperoxidase family enzyme